MTVSKLDINLVRSIPLLAKLSDVHLSNLAASASFRQAPARTDLFAEGDQPKNLHVLTKGVVKLYTEHDERCATIAIVYPVRPLLLASIWSGRYPLSARRLSSRPN